MIGKPYTLAELKELFKPIFKNYNVKKAILFGSYAKNKQTKNSDIDIMIDSDGKLLNINFYGLLEDLVEASGKKIDLFEITEINKNSTLYNSIMKEGIIIYNSS